MTLKSGYEEKTPNWPKFLLGLHLPQRKLRHTRENLRSCSLMCLMVSISLRTSFIFILSLVTLKSWRTCATDGCSTNLNWESPWVLWVLDLWRNQTDSERSALGACARTCIACAGQRCHCNCSSCSCCSWPSSCPWQKRPTAAHWPTTSLAPSSWCWDTRAHLQRNVLAWHEVTGGSADSLFLIAAVVDFRASNPAILSTG